MIAQAVIQLPARDPNVPYKLLNAAARKVAEQHPEASIVRPVWAPASSAGDILVQITENGRTRTVVPR